MLGDPTRDVEQLAHAAVPPIVRPVTRNVGWPSPTGTPWPSLPHVPGLPIAKSLPSTSMLRKHVGTVPDEVALAERIGELAVLDHVRLVHAEHEVAGRGVHLATAEVRHVHPVIGLADDLVRVVGAVQHERVGHAHHREVVVALAAAVARRVAALLASAQEVPHVVGEDPVLDQDVALRGMALVVDADRAPLAAHGAVVDERDQR